ncbi:alpha/beta hydrolase [Parafrankia discariae]|uniref:alpha/beta hydrolase n=1 Tax=Parafrankia discariae TaxID=365528 RepID=UPI0003681E2A|nr:alpha/beta hydrolase-fold protein [Parafrankia discariae]
MGSALSSLVIIGTWFLLLLGALSAVCWAGCVWVARRRRAVAVGLGLLAALLTLATAADTVNAHYGYLPRAADVLGLTSWPTASVREVVATSPRPNAAGGEQPAGGRHPDGAVVHLPVAGVRSGFGTHSALVYVPPQYFTDLKARFPVVYLFHGSPGIPLDWYRAGQAAKIGATLAREGRPAILVAPALGHGWLDDSECVDRPGERIETYLLDDVIPTVDRLLRAVPDRADRVFAGISAGGFCALNLGLRHRDLVETIVDISGLAKPTHSGGMAGLFGNRPDLAAVTAANNPQRYAPTLPPNPPTRVWLSGGLMDFGTLADLRMIALALHGRPGFTTVLRPRPGGHDFAVWRPALRDGLRWALP